MPEPPPAKPYTAAEMTPLSPPVDPLATLRSALRGHYEFERELGQGAFATVYLARDLKHERKVAIKVLHADPNSEMGELRFIREIRMLARLQHPNILPLHDSGHVEALLYYVMPYVSGETLRERIQREKQLQWETACAITREIADALSYAHAQGIIHRDIKPENILISAGHPMLADFGIARAINLGGVLQLTRTGMGSPGTPAYMSPEQLLGEKEIDSRSDTYSLGCVLFEMLTGKPPFAGKDGFVKRFTEPPPSATRIRSDLPGWVDGALARSLEHDPDARYANASDFAKALCDPPHIPALAPHHARVARGNLVNVPISRRAGSFWPRIHLPAPSRSLVIGALAVVALSVATFMGAPAIRRVIAGSTKLDSSRFVIVPSGELAAAAASDALRAEQRLYDSFAAWKGLQLVSDAAVDEAVRADGGAATSLRSALAVARQVGARNLIWIRRGVTGSGIRAELFDAAEGTSSGRVSMLDASASDRDFSLATIGLISIANRPVLARGGDGLTNSFDAWMAYNRGHVALAEWNPAEAARQFATALNADAAFSAASVWLAQVQEWTDPSARTDWGPLAAKASTDTRLDGRDLLISQGLVALAEQRFPAACDAYRRLSAMKGSEFIGWYGLGECQSLDSAVVPSEAIASGWRFRSSYGAAARAYTRAMEIEPRARSIFPFSRLHGLLPTSATRVRVGRASSPKNQIFLAYPSLVGPHDTLAFIPHPLQSFASLPASVFSKQNAALQADIALLTQYTTEWIRQLPNDPAAFAARAEILEISGDIGGEPFEQTPVMRALRQVRSLSHDPHTVFETLVKEVWLRFKREDFAEARKLADSLLTAYPNPTTGEAEGLLPIAALTGKLGRTVLLGRIVYPFLPATDEALPVQVRDAASEFLITAAAGLCGDRLNRLDARLNDALVRYLPATRAKELHAELTARPLSLAVPCTNGRSALGIDDHRMKLYEIQRDFAMGNVKATRALLDTAAQIASHGRPGDKSLDYTFQESWVRVAVGDTAIAMRMLDNVLGALPSFSSDNLQELGAASAAAQAMVFRARLAAAEGDARTARQWAKAAFILWSTADPVIRDLGRDVWQLAN